jgi:membrane protein DedA with SNARE-associated domain
MKEKYELYNFWIVFTAGFTPIPYKVITISAGAFRVQFLVFLIASVISRGARFFLISFLVFWFGQPIKAFIDKYFNWLALLFTVLLVLGFLLLKGVL